MKFFSQYFQSFSMFIFNGSLLKKFYQFFKIYKSFYKKREKMIIQLSMRKEQLRKTGICFITGYLIRPFNMTVIHFFFNWSFCSREFFFSFRKLVCNVVFAFWYQDDSETIKRGNWERQIARNNKLQHLF